MQALPCCALSLVGAPEIQDVPAPTVRHFINDDQGLAKDGVRFRRAASSCRPSRAVLPSGQHIHPNGTFGLQHLAHHHQNVEAVHRLPLVLKAMGWTTAQEETNDPWLLEWKRE